MPPAPAVFVVDDEEPVRSSLGRLLRALGFDSSTYASAESFLESYDGKHEGSLLLDLRMPGMSGLDLLEELSRRQISLPVIIMTGHTDDESIRRLAMYETLGFLEKPFSVEQLKAVLERSPAGLPQA
jgi:FixJ family two-component response regulator